MLMLLWLFPSFEARGFENNPAYLASCSQHTVTVSIFNNAHLIFIIMIIIMIIIIIIIITIIIICETV